MDQLNLELKRPIMSFKSKRTSIQSKKSAIKHESKKLLGGNSLSDGKENCLFFLNILLYIYFVSILYISTKFFKGINVVFLILNSFLQ